MWSEIRKILLNSDYCINKKIYNETCIRAFSNDLPNVVKTQMDQIYQKTKHRPDIEKILISNLDNLLSMYDNEINEEKQYNIEQEQRALLPKKRKIEKKQAVKQLKDNLLEILDSDEEDELARAAEEIIQLANYEPVSQPPSPSRDVEYIPTRLGKNRLNFNVDQLISDKELDWFRNIGLNDEYPAEQIEEYMRGNIEWGVMHFSHKQFRRVTNNEQGWILFHLTQKRRNIVIHLDAMAVSPNVMGRKMSEAMLQIFLTDIFNYYPNANQVHTELLNPKIRNMFKRQGFVDSMGDNYIYTKV